MKYKVGQKFNRLTLIEYKGSSKWLCRCDCGIEKIISYSSFTRGTKSCGCLRKETASHNGNANQILIPIGTKYTKLTVMKYVGNKQWECLCECGNTCLTTYFYLSSGRVKSCGCRRAEARNENLIKGRTLCRIGSNVSKTELLFGDLIEAEYDIKLDRAFRLNDRIYDIRYNNILIESDGKYWHSRDTDIVNDEYKNNLAKENNFILLRFSLNSMKEVRQKWKTEIKPILDKYFTEVTKCSS